MPNHFPRATIAFFTQKIRRRRLGPNTNKFTGFLLSFIAEKISAPLTEAITSTQKPREIHGKPWKYAFHLHPSLPFSLKFYDY
jgi:hypothetical protein